MSSSRSSPAVFAPAVFAALTLVPAIALAWLGWSSTDALADELRRTARDEAFRVAHDAAAALPRAVTAAGVAATTRLQGVAARLGQDLPLTAPGRALRRAEAALGEGALNVVGADGSVLVPRGPIALAGPELPEWGRYCAVLRAGAATGTAAVESLRTPLLRLRAQAHLWPVDDRDAFAVAARDVPDTTVVAAGPQVVEVLLASAAGRDRVRTLERDGWLAAVPATAAARARWLDAIAADAGERARADLRGAAAVGAAAGATAGTAEEGTFARFVRTSAPLPGGARLDWLRERAAVIATLRLEVPTDICVLGCAAASAPAPLHWQDEATAALALDTAIGAIAVTARHTGLADAAAHVGDRRWLTGLGIGLLLLTITSGLTLARRALHHERSAARLRDEFLANVSHELKTPLTSLRMHAEMLGAADLDAATRARYAAVAAAEGERLTALVDDLLDFAALQRGRRQLECEPVDLGAAARALAAGWQPLCARAGAELECAVAGEVQALADPRALARIVGNLLQNAVRHGRPARAGGASRIAVVVGPGPAVEVRDNGPGVPSELRERVFERFERVHRGGVGIGLGLALSRGLAEAMGGRLTCGDDGAATVFRLELPPVPDLGPDDPDGPDDGGAAERRAADGREVGA